MPFVGELAALITAVLWSFTSIVFTEASIKVGSNYVNIARLILAVVYLVFTILIAGLDFTVTLNQIMFLAISGLIGLVFGDTFLFKAFQHIGARLSMLIMSLVPPISAFLAFIFLGETLSLLGIIGIVITVGGIALVVLQREETPSSKYKISGIGIFYGVLGAVGQAVGLIFAKWAFMESEVNGFVASLYRILPSVIVLYPLMKFSHRIEAPIRKFAEDRKALLYTIIGSIIGPFLGITFSMIAISYAKVGIASTIIASVPIIMLPIVKFYYKEELSLKSISGAFLAVGGIAILFLH